MSVQTQIDRIDGNVKKALAKIAEKGVSVAADANSDDLEALIATIEAGGGGGDGELETKADKTYVDSKTAFCLGVAGLYSENNELIKSWDK